MGGTRSPKSLVPSPLAHTAQSGGGQVFYHGTSHEFGPGSLVEPGHEPVHDPTNMHRDASEYVFFTSDLENAQGYAEDAAARKGTSAPRVYLVKPTGTHEADPEYDDEMADQYRRSRHPLRIIREVQSGHRTASAWTPQVGIFGPTTGLDHRLFNTRFRLRPEVRGAIMERLDRCIRTDAGLAGSDWQDWTRVYLLGGSVSEWAGSRPNETAQDLDVIVAIDLAGAQRHNAFEGMSGGQAASALNTAFRKHFNEDGWQAPFGGQWDLTAFCNQRAWDITVIKPYAAWDLTHGAWAVTPPHLPEHTLADFSPAVLAQARAVAAEARAILRMDEPLRTREARALWDRIHAGRSMAFSEQGTGWDDPANVTEKWLAYAPHGLLGRIRDLAFAKTASGPGGEVSFTYVPATGSGTHAITVHPRGAELTKENRVGRLSWTDEPGGSRIVNLWVHPDYQRHGIATEMHRQAREISPELRHAANPTEAGQAWISGMQAKTAAAEDEERPEEFYYGRMRTRDLTPTEYPHILGSSPRVDEIKADARVSGEIREPIEVHQYTNDSPIRDGNHRWRAAMDLGIETVPVKLKRRSPGEPFGMIGPVRKSGVVQKTAAAQDYLRNPYHGNPEIGGRDDWSHTWFHGTKGSGDMSGGRPAEAGDHGAGAGSSWPQPNKLLGTHFSPLHSVAHGFAYPTHGYRKPGQEGYVPGDPATLVHARLRSQNPAHFPTEQHLNLAIARWADKHAPAWHDRKLNDFLAFSYQNNEGTHRDWHAEHPADSNAFHGLADQAQHALSWHPRLPEILKGFTDHLHARGHDVITYGNNVEGPFGSVSAIATHPSQIDVTHVEHVAPHDRPPGPQEVGHARPGDVNHSPGQDEPQYEGAYSSDLNEPEEMHEAIERLHTGQGKGDARTYPRRVTLAPGYREYREAAKTAAANPPCHYCGEPLDDEDVRDQVSSHDECQEMRWCEAHQDHHDDPAEAEDHNSTYTDWSEHLPFEHGIHRGLTVRLPEAAHQAVHDPARPLADRARELGSRLHEDHGVHWTDRLPIAQAWGTGEGALFSGVDPKDPAHTHVVLHAASPAEEHIEDNPEELSRRNLWGFGHDRSEREIPLKAGAPVHLTGVSWKRGGESEWNRHDFAGGSSHTAARDDDDDPDRYVTCEQGHRHWGAAGAAGLLIRHRGDDGAYRYLLQHRSPDVQHGGTWSTPGGALQRGESPEEGARREAEEEFGALPSGLKHHHTFTDDHGGWAYHTVVMDAPHRFEPDGGGEDDWEHGGHGWFTPQEMKDLPLHPGFAASWDHVRKSGAVQKTGRQLGPWQQWTKDRPHKAVINRAQESFRAANPDLTGPLDERDWDHPPDRARESEAGRKKLLGMLYEGHHPRAHDAWVMPHNQPGRGVSQVAVDQNTGAPGVVLHPDRWDAVTLAHEAAHLVDAHRRGVDLAGFKGADGDQVSTGIPDEEMHGPEFARHYANALDTLRHGAGDDFLRHHAAAVKLVGNQRYRVHGEPREFGGLGPSGPGRPQMPPRQEALHDPSLDYRDYREKGLELAKNPDPGTVLWRSEHLPAGEDHSSPESVGMHWSVKPEQVIHMPDRHGLHTVVYQARLHDPGSQAIPRSHPIWSGRHESMPSEAEVRLHPGGSVHVEGLWVPGRTSEEGRGPLRTLSPHRMRPGDWNWHPVGRDVPVRYRGQGATDYSDVGIHREAAAEDRGANWVDDARKTISDMAAKKGHQLTWTADETDERRPYRTNWWRAACGNCGEPSGRPPQRAKKEVVLPQDPAENADHWLGDSERLPHWLTTRCSQGRPRKKPGSVTEGRAQLGLDVRKAISGYDSPVRSNWRVEVMHPRDLMQYVETYRTDDEGGRRHRQNLAESLRQHGYDPDLHGGMSGDKHSFPVSSPITLVHDDGASYFEEGNHRAHALNDVGWDEHVPVLVKDLRKSKTAVSGYTDLGGRTAMIYLDIPPGLVEPHPGGVDDQHITLVYLGKNVSDAAWTEACRQAEKAAAQCAPMDGVLRGIDIFPPSPSSDGKVPVFVPAYIAGVGRLRRELEDLSASEHKDFRPHLSLAYLEEGDSLPAERPAVSVRFTRLYVKRGDEILSYPLGGRLSAQGSRPGFYHGSYHDMAPGDELTPDGANETGRRYLGSGQKHVFYTGDMGLARAYGPKVYRVQPLAPPSGRGRDQKRLHDPEPGFPREHEYLSSRGFRVLERVDDDEAKQAWDDRAAARWKSRGGQETIQRIVDRDGPDGLPESARPHYRPLR